jgi:hypothetical protein
MGCTRELVNFVDTQHYAYLITDEDTSKQIFIPLKEAFDYIRFRIVNRKNRLADAYEMAGSAYKAIIPPANLIPAVKFLYTNFEDQFTEIGDRTFREWGPWLFNEACMILKSTDESGRIDLGDGFVVPNPEERGCIYDAIFNQGKTLKRAMFGCCPDIIYPETAYVLIEDQIVNKHYQFFEAVRNAHTGIIGPIPTAGGRIALGEEFVIPSESELSDIGDAIFNLGWTLSQAYAQICPDITPVAKAISCIEKKILGTGSVIMSPSSGESFTDIYKSCYKELAGTKNILIYGLIASFGLFIILRNKKTG